ncbi:FAD-binding oxidoreductase [Streptomyces sp. NBC_01498]|uniref:FAD-binding oxidoreductase n=1 Tax=Streptomyces sp. NBC_01498 TaxID=2975870 RepID=UPI002E7BA4F4|nr:FAD-binding oxidoreductase [Streptomyces sp. NBC_01498]WTL26903.1 FAD-binding oxidoreductase [Streptomyces sp. NBC_01498]
MSDNSLAALPRVFRAGDPGYDPELEGFQLGFPSRPEVVVGATGTDDVRAAVAHAAAHGLPVGVRATGHGVAAAAEGGLLISTKRMDGVRIDPVARTARIEAGVRWRQVVAAAGPYGLAPLNGSAPGVGAVSYTLGGGLGLLGREFGYAADHVRSLEVVTADGRLRRVTPSSDPDLFWALLGGGHNFGVVTGLETGLMPVERLYGGALSFDGRLREEVVVGYLDWLATVPETLTSALAVMVHPNMDQVPQFLRGRYTLSVRIVFTGDAAEGERLVAPLREIGPTVTDSLREMPYTRSATIHNDPEQPHPYWGDSAMVSALDAGTLTELLAMTGPDAPTMCIVQVNPLGGALARQPEVPNAVPYREAAFLVRGLSPLAGPDPAAVREVYGRFFGRLAPVTVGRSLNFVFGDGARTEGLYDGETVRRLGELKARYDPANLFRRNYNIRPATS